MPCTIPGGTRPAPVAHRYRAFFALLDGDQVPERDGSRPWPGPSPHPPTASIEALPAGPWAHEPRVAELRAPPVGHPRLVLALGRRPAAAPAQPDGCDVERAVPCDRYPRHGDVVLAEHTLPFNGHDSTYDHPLHRRATANLGFQPTDVSADAAFDAGHIYQTRADAGGLAASPLAPRGHPPPRDEQGHPRRAEGRSMTPSHEFDHTDGRRARLFRCPLLAPPVTGATCPPGQFAKGLGCVRLLNIDIGGRMRAESDRQAADYTALDRQRTAAERINGQATALGIERPRVRRQASARTLTPLTPLVSNARAVQRARTLDAQPVAPSALC